MGIVLALACIFASSASADVATSTCAGADALPGTTSIESFDGSLLCLINAERSNVGLVELKSNHQLREAAVGHSTSMVSRGYFGHTEPGGANYRQRILRSGYIRGERRWLIGQNIGTGVLLYGSPRAMVIAWMNSPEHRRNILEPSFREIGIGARWGAPTLANPSLGVTITTDFGRTQG